VSIPHRKLAMSYRMSVVGLQSAKWYVNGDLGDARPLQRPAAPAKEVLAARAETPSYGGPATLLCSSSGRLLARIAFVFDTGLMYSSYIGSRYEGLIAVTVKVSRRLGRERAS